MTNKRIKLTNRGGSVSNLVDESITRDRIDELLAFLPLFESLAGKDVELAGGGVMPDGTLHLLYPSYPDDVHLFFRLASQPWWLDASHLARRSSSMLEHSSIATADLDQLRTVMTYCVRAERFFEGFWATMIKAGTVVAILRRLEALREEAA